MCVLFAFSAACVFSSHTHSRGKERKERSQANSWQEPRMAQVASHWIAMRPSGPTKCTPAARSCVRNIRYSTTCTSRASRAEPGTLAPKPARANKRARLSHTRLAGRRVLHRAGWLAQQRARIEMTNLSLVCYLAVVVVVDSQTRLSSLALVFRVAKPARLDS